MYLFIKIDFRKLLKFFSWHHVCQPVDPTLDIWIYLPFFMSFLKGCNFFLYYSKRRNFILLACFFFFICLGDHPVISRSSPSHCPVIALSSPCHRPVIGHCPVIAQSRPLTPTVPISNNLVSLSPKSKSNFDF